MGASPFAPAAAVAVPPSPKEDPQRVLFAGAASPTLLASAGEPPPAEPQPTDTLDQADEELFVASDELRRREGFWLEGMSPAEAVGSARYVDDVIGVSRVYCCDCLTRWMELTYSLGISVAGTSEDTNKPVVWADVEVRTAGWDFFVVPKNLNRAWLVDASVERERATVLPWAGVPA